MVDVHFGVPSLVFVIPGFLRQIGHGAGGFDDSSGDFQVKAQVHGDGGTEVNSSTTSRVWSPSLKFRDFADIVDTHIGFRKDDCEAQVFARAGEFVDEPLQSLKHYYTYIMRLFGKSTNRSHYPVFG